jgi:uncharacterized membrane protein (UPF0127 family)
LRKYRVGRGKKEEGREVAVRDAFSLNFYFIPTVFLFFSSLLLLLSSFLFVPYRANADSSEQVCFKDQCFAVETVDTAESRTRGLQDRTSLPADEGMLFVFPTEDIFNFWMKDTSIALDMIWINEGHTIVDIKTDVPPCTQEPCPIYVPSGKARYVLEVNANFAKTHELKVGDQVVINSISDRI